ncbi:hypothetical protein RQP46_004961 [Phenoliferia psychrophenolica]
MVTFEEPSLPTLLTLISLIYALQVARGVAQRLVGAGLLGEIAVGIIYGPVANILQEEFEVTILALGYIGLVLIVFEGGLDIDLDLFLPTLPLASLSAFTGVLLPLAFTFALFASPSFNLPPLQAFSAGAALASTSLGTTFYVLRAQAGTTDLAATRISAVLVSAALIDDIIALVLLSVLTSLGAGAVTNLGWTIGRPIVASLALAIGGPAVAFLVARPLFRKFAERRVIKFGSNAALLVGIAVLSAFLAIAAYAGTTMLLGAYIAGVFLFALPSPGSDLNFKHVYTETVGPLQTYIFSPFFFCSIGFTIPFLSLWTGRIIWRGVVYALLMTLGKVLVGLCVVVADSFSPSPTPPSSLIAPEGTSASPTTAAEKPSFASSHSNLSSASSLKRVHLPTLDVLPPAAFLGLALVARGEIGVLVLQVARNSPGDLLGEEAYLVALWAVALCTIVGPIAFSALVRRYGEGIVNGRWGVQR